MSTFGTVTDAKPGMEAASPACANVLNRNRDHWAAATGSRIRHRARCLLSDRNSV